MRFANHAVLLVLSMNKMRKRKKKTDLALHFVAVFAIGWVLVAGSVVKAVPVTFAFDAEITSINRSADATFDLPFSAMVGDTFSGLLEFEPFDFGQSAETSSLKVHLGSEVFSIEDTILYTYRAIPPPGLRRAPRIRTGCPSSELGLVPWCMCCSCFVVIIE